MAETRTRAEIIDEMMDMLCEMQRLEAENDGLRARLATAEAERDRLREDAALLDALDVAPFALRTYVLEGRRHTVAHSAHTTATFSNARDAIRAASRAPSTGGTP